MSEIRETEEDCDACAAGKEEAEDDEGMMGGAECDGDDADDDEDSDRFVRLEAGAGPESVELEEMSDLRLIPSAGGARASVLAKVTRHGSFDFLFGRI